MKILLMKRFV